MRLTHRDKILLLAFVLIAIWALGIWFIIRPQIQDVGTADDELTAIQSDYDKVQQDLEAAKTVKEDCNTILKQAQESGSGFYGIMRAYEAEDIVATLLNNESNPISIDGMSITGPSAVALTPYANSQSAGLNVPIIDSVQAPGTAEADPNAAGTAAAAPASETVACYNYNITFKASKANLMAFLDKIPTSNNKASLVVTSLSITDINEEAELEGTMAFSLYFINELKGANVDELIENLSGGASTASDDAQAAS